MTAHCSVAVDVPTSLLIAGRRMLTADVFALTTSVETQVATRTPRPARVVVFWSVAIAPIVGRSFVDGPHLFWARRGRRWVDDDLRS